MTSPSEADPYEAAWSELRALKRWRLLATLGYLPFAGVVISVSKLFRPYEGYFMPLVLAWFLFVVVTSMRVLLFDCPACGEWFFFKWKYRNDFARRCVHCGVAMSEDSGRGSRTR
jgi:hypothetical protein